MTKEDLITALEQADGPSRYLDGLIAVRLGWGHHFGDDDLPEDWPECGGYWTAPDGGRDIEPPLFTASVDAALTLVPDGCYWAVWSSAIWPGGGHYHATCYRSGGGWIDDSPEDQNNSEASAPAIALCIAALRARA